ncbi:hypothetical protein ABGB12_18530 [Actinocorallia sp. B10E7]|uniref:hypothetical protein n=1 Tax=Actinocorallia sp. B10E7 TaxID=3153558 RepID=UPI00325CCD3C
MTDLVAVTGVAALGTGTTGILGWAATRLLLRRFENLPLFALWAVTLLATAAGTLSVTQAMYLSGHDLAVMLVVLAVGAGTSLLTAWLLGRQAAADRRRARAHEAARRELVAWVSRDLQAPLAGLRDALDASDAPEHLRSQVDRIAGLADDLLEITRS